MDNLRLGGWWRRWLIHCQQRRRLLLRRNLHRWLLESLGFRWCRQHWRRFLLRWNLHYWPLVNVSSWRCREHWRRLLLRRNLHRRLSIEPELLTNTLWQVRKLWRRSLGLRHVWHHTASLGCWSISVRGRTFTCRPGTIEGLRPRSRARSFRC